MSEMIVILPMLIAIIGGGMFVIFGAWQGIRVQQAANIAGRMQGQERIDGGVSPTAIDQENGADQRGDEDPTAAGNDPSSKFNGKPSNVPTGNVYGKYYNLVKDEFFANSKDNVFIPAPELGQNIDKVKIVRLIDLPKIPFLNWNMTQQVKLEGTAWGGEDTYAYALPRWGKVGGQQESEWHSLSEQGLTAEHDKE